MKRDRHIWTRSLPKTGQSISYRTGDDGTYETGWWKNHSLADNLTRFILKAFSGDVVTLDRATGLMWAKDGNGAGCNNGAADTWNNVIDYCEALSFAGFTDWRVPNVHELASIIDHSIVSPCVLSTYFSNTVLSTYWSSSTRINITTQAWTAEFVTGYISTNIKTNNHYLRAVRTYL